MDKYFIALEPELKLKNLINSKKSFIRNLIGDQKYLSEEPHTTLIVLTSESIAELLDEIEKISLITEKIKLNITGLNVFFKDVLTDNNTLVCSFDQNSLKKLRNFQIDLIKKIDKFNTKKSILINSKDYLKFNEQEREKIKEYGFPYIEDNWIPHITLASIEENKFKRVFDVIEKNDMKESYFLDHISLYNISQSNLLVKKFKLK